MSMKDLIYVYFGCIFGARLNIEARRLTKPARSLARPGRFRIDHAGKPSGRPLGRHAAKSVYSIDWRVLVREIPPRFCIFPVIYRRRPRRDPTLTSSYVCGRESARPCRRSLARFRRRRYHRPDAVAPRPCPLMLIGLTIRDFVLIERLDLTLKPGLCVLTGETGAGKSILLDALGLALGMRAESGLVRSGASQAAVSAAFSPPADHPAC